MIKRVSLFYFALTLIVCAQETNSVARLEIHNDRILKILNKDINAEVLASGFTWSEGPAWHNEQEKLYFSDVPENKMYSWSENDGLKIEHDPSGSNINIEGFREPGTNGILVVPSTGKLLVANHGIRGLQFIDTTTKERETLTELFQSKKFNSPNDVALAEDGTIYFTDPPYGLRGINNSPLKEQPHNGVYKRATNGVVTLVDGSLSYPNGIHLSPDNRSLYVSVSDGNRPVIMKYTLQQNGEFGAGYEWFDTKPYMNENTRGLPDGMTIGRDGTVYASGPGGIFIIDPSGELLGIIALDRAAANCTLGPNEKSLFITASDVLMRVPLEKGSE